MGGTLELPVAGRTDTERIALQIDVCRRAEILKLARSRSILPVLRPRRRFSGRKTGQSCSRVVERNALCRFPAALTRGAAQGKLKPKGRQYR